MDQGHMCSAFSNVTRTKQHDVLACSLLVPFLLNPMRNGLYLLSAP